MGYHPSKERLTIQSHYIVMSKSSSSKVSSAKIAAAKPLDLSRAKVATAALPARSIYEIMGITSKEYRTHDYATYQEDLKSMTLHALHEHAYEVGVAATEDRNHLIDALERKFLQEHGRQGRARETTEKTQAQILREQALRALSHGV